MAKDDAHVCYAISNPRAALAWTTLAFFAGFSGRRADVTAYVFNPDADRPTVVVTVGVGF